MKAYNAEFGVGNLDLLANTFTKDNGDVVEIPWVTVDGVERMTLVTQDAKRYLFIRLEKKP